MQQSKLDKCKTLVKISRDALQHNRQMAAGGYAIDLTKKDLVELGPLLKETYTEYEAFHFRNWKNRQWSLNQLVFMMKKVTRSLYSH